MITYIEGDLFNSPAQVLVNTVNTVGVMGKGIALEFKKRYPEMFKQYKKMCDEHKLTIGRLMLWYEQDHWLLQFPTKENWRNPSKIEYIEKGLAAFVKKYADYNISSIAFPKLGCGNGELNWGDVKIVMEKYLNDLPIDVYVYLRPLDKQLPEHKKTVEMTKWLRQNAKDMSFAGVKDDISYSSALVPITFEVEEMKWTASWNDEDFLIFENGEETLKLSDEDARAIWDKISEKRVFATDDNKIHDLFYILLAHMGYLDEVNIDDNMKAGLKKGYQLNSWKGQAFLVKGDK